VLSSACSSSFLNLKPETAEQEGESSQGAKGEGRRLGHALACKNGGIWDRFVCVIVYPDDVQAGYRGASPEPAAKGLTGLLELKAVVRGFEPGEGASTSGR
jgi:hypothetical protein